MEELLRRIIANWNQPQLLSLFVTVLVILIFSLVVFFKLKKLKANQAPKGVVLVAEAYINFFDTTYDDATEGNLPKTKFYLLTLGTFLLVGNLVSIIGLEPIVTSYSIPLTLGLSTFIGIYVVGLTYKKLRFFKKYINPVEIVGQFAPLISISFRIYGNIIGGGTIVTLIYYAVGWIWTQIPGLQNHEWFFFAPFLTPLIHLYFDIFGAFIQAYVFTLLTAVYWVGELPEDYESTKKPKKLQTKATKINQSVY